MKIINLIKCEFIKNFSIKKLLIATLLLFFASFFILKLTETGEIHLDNSIKYRFDNAQEEYNKLLNKKDKTLEEEYNIVFYEYYLELLDILKSVKTITYDRQSEIFFNVISYKTQNFLIDKIINEHDNDTIKNSCKAKDKTYSSEMEKTINDLCNNYTEEELIDLYKKNDEKYNDYKKLFEEDKYYLYLKYEVEHGNLESDEFIEMLIDKKVEKMTGIVALNYLQYISVGKGDVSYLQENKKIKHDNEAFRAILSYSSIHNIPHDIEYNYWNNVSSEKTYMTTKKAVNQVYHLSFIIMIIISITCGGIISNEHNKGTIKNLITTPTRRWKIVLSKFIYLVLNTYLLWFIGLIAISLLAGLKYGFSDLLTPKLVYMGSKVVEVNYYLYTIKMIFLASIPLICYLSILLFISTISLNTSLTVGITSVLGVLAPVVWIMSVAGNIKQIVYTPLWYFDCGFMFNNDVHYIETILFKNVYFDLSTGIISSIIVIIILYIVTNIVYIKRDIKN